MKMRQSWMTHRAMVFGATLLVSLGLVSTASAANRVFNNAAADGLWLTAGNWIGGVPVAGDTAFLNTNTTATVDGAAPGPLAAIHVGQGAGNGGVIVNSGSLDSGALNLGLAGTVGTYEQNGGAVTVGTRWNTGAGGGASTAVITDGTFDITGNAAGVSLVVSTAAASSGSSISQSGGTVGSLGGQTWIGQEGTGVYALSGAGVFDATGGQTIVGVGLGSTGSELNQSGTSDFDTSNLTIGHQSNSKYAISGGTGDITGALKVANLASAAGASVEQTGGTVTVGGFLQIGVGGSGSYTQSAGTVNANNLFGAGWASAGTYTLSGTGVLNGGSVIAGLDNGSDGSLIDQQGGTLNAAVLTAGRLGRADFQISGGDAVVNHVKVADGVGAGLLNPAGSQVIQTGGKVDAANDILVGGTASGSYIISDGTLEFDGTIIVRNDSTFKVIGDSATIVDTLDPGAQNGMAISTGALEFEFASAGVSVVDLGTSTFAIPMAQGPKIVVDGTAYTGGPGTIPLVTFDGYGGIAADMGWASETINGFAGYNASIVNTNSSVDLVLTVVPEPSTWILGSLAAMVLVTRRRRG